MLRRRSDAQSKPTTETTGSSSAGTARAERAREPEPKDDVAEDAREPEMMRAGARTTDAALSSIAALEGRVEEVARRAGVPAAGHEGYTRIVVTAGPNTYNPIKYNGFTVGPVTVEATLLPGETLEAAWLRAQMQAHLLLEADYETAFRRYLDHVRGNVAAVRAARDLPRERD